jgi:hypothetical protein
VVLAICALAAAGLATFTALDPFNLAWADGATAVLVGVTITLLTIGAAGAQRRRARRVLVAVLGTVVFLAWCAAVVVAVRFAGHQRVVSQVDAAGYRLVVVEGHAFADPVYSVLLRRGSGPLVQEALVWQGLAKGAAPAEARFRGDPVADPEVEVIAGPGCGYRSRFDPVTLAVDPVHRPLRLDGC